MHNINNKFHYSVAWIVISLVCNEMSIHVEHRQTDILHIWLSLTIQTMQEHENIKAKIFSGWKNTNRESQMRYWHSQVQNYSFFHSCVPNLSVWKLIVKNKWVCVWSNQHRWLTLNGHLCTILLDFLISSRKRSKNIELPFNI